MLRKDCGNSTLRVRLMRERNLVMVYDKHAVPVHVGIQSIGLSAFNWLLPKSCSEACRPHRTNASQ